MAYRRLAARALEFLGLLLVLNAVMLGVFADASMGFELQLGLGGVAAFTLGYLLDPGSRA